MPRRFAFLWPWRGAKSVPLFGCRLAIADCFAAPASREGRPIANRKSEIANRKEGGSAAPSPAAAHQMPLTHAPLKRALRVVHIHGGAQRFRRLSEMGLFPGVELRIVSGGSHGPVLLQIGDTRLALGSGLAEAVVVVAAGDKPAAAAD